MSTPEVSFIIEDAEEEEYDFVFDPKDTHKRHLTSQEVEYILKDIKPVIGIPYDTSKSISDSIKLPLRDELQSLEVYPKIIPNLRKEIGDNYERCKIQPGESIGITAAQSFGQFYTQSTLNTFHTAGLAVKAVVSGVVRFEEILNATTKPKGVCCTIKFKDNNTTLYKLRESLKSSIVYFDIKKVSSTIKYSPSTKSCPDWYDSFKILYNNNFEHLTHYITIELNKKLLYEYLIDIEDIATAIETVYTDLFCVFSPIHIGVIHVYADTSSITLPDEILHYVTQENMISVYMEEVVIPNLEKLKISGINDVENAFFMQDKDTWYIDTEGGDFAELLTHPLIDMENTTTNSIWDIYNTLGIEAVRQFLVEELVSIMPSISIYHSKFLVDYMTKTGTITSISRYTMRSEGSGALSKASFEETLDNLINAGLHGEIENPNSVSTSIICGKLGKFGTGICELKVDVSKLQKIIKQQVTEKN
jgi:DNA-directed RNA polymerase beta' subunit